MGLYANIYDCGYGRDALSVLPKMASQVFVANVEGPFERKAGEAAVMLESHMPGIVRAVPINEAGEVDGWLMKGYSFIGCSDSRFSRKVEQLIGGRFYGAVALHDRKEN